MTGPEHYRLAERMLRSLADPECDYDPAAIALAQVHATLALAAATAVPAGDFHAWREATSLSPAPREATS